MGACLAEVNECEVCGNNSLESVLRLGEHPMCDDLIEVGSDRICKTYPVEILFCTVCKTSLQKYQIPQRELFPESYHYRSRFTEDVLSGMRSFVSCCEAEIGNLKGKKVLDVGCNDGSLLDFFKEKGACTFGFEPTGASKDAEIKQHYIVNSFFSVETATEFLNQQEKPDLITFTNVFAHIENLEEVLKALKILCHEKTVIVIENHYLGSILQNNQFDTFYHEHPRTYSLNSFKFIAESLGMVICAVDFPSRYGGNIRVVLSKKPRERNIDIQNILDKEKSFLSMFHKMNAGIQFWQERKKCEIKRLKQKYGPLKAKAFPGRAAILVKLLNIDESYISAVYEKPGSLKVGNYLPGTRIPILSDDELFGLEDTNTPILNLAWHIPNEIRGYLKDKYSGAVVDILSPADLI